MPLKAAAFEQVDHVDPVTRRIGALNTITRHETGLIGTNTDWQAINLILDRKGLHPRRAAIVGTGGAARAALEEMRQAKIEQVDLVSRSPDRARALLIEFGLSGEVLPPEGAPTADLLINASPLGMTGQPVLPIELGNVAVGGTVFDMVYSPVETRLLGQARSRGLRTIDGLTMLVHQAALAFANFFGDAPDPVESGELRERLTS